MSFLLSESVRYVPLTKGRFALVDSSDYERVVSSGQWHYARGYAVKQVKIKDKYRQILLHRFIMEAKSGEIIDHADGDGLNNCRSNLRICTHSENMRNRRISKNNTTGYKGVVFNGSSWVAQMRHNKETIYLGSYPDPILAAKAYNAAALERQGAFAKLNIIPS
jgi:hypothetical protein